MVDASRLSRIALVLAALLALAATATAIWRSRAPTPETATTAPPPSPEQAIAGLEAKLKANPNDPDGWRLLGWSFFATGRYAESATAYKRATQLDPAKAEYWSSLGEALTLAGPGDVPADAKTAFETALKRDPADPRSRYFLAVAKDMAGDHMGAIGDWITLLNTSPADAPWVADVRRAVTQVAAKNHIDVAARLAAIHPTAPQGTAAAAIPGPTPDQMRAATALPPGQQQAMVDSMVSGLAQKLAANSRNPDGWIMLMRSYTQLGRMRDASAALVSAKAANPEASASLDSAAKELGIR
ncbi:MAG: tetratricopeptide repeat protein [Sphingomonadaceae bacterium]|nr:tetratricopeptide repeat protein [Sphingomonadaceae bacterium]